MRSIFRDSHLEVGVAKTKVCRDRWAQCWFWHFRGCWEQWNEIEHFSHVLHSDIRVWVNTQASCKNVWNVCEIWSVSPACVCSAIALLNLTSSVLLFSWECRRSTLKSQNTEFQVRNWNIEWGTEPHAVQTWQRLFVYMFFFGVVVIMHLAVNVIKEIILKL